MGAIYMSPEFLEEIFPEHTDAVSLLLDLWQVMQAWDDAFDKDDADHHEAYKTALLYLPQNPLYNACSVPFLVAQCYYDWMTANVFEQAGIQLEKAYMLRAGYYRIIISLVHMLQGAEKAEEVAPRIWGYYGEKFTAYQEELSNA